MFKFGTAASLVLAAAYATPFKGEHADAKHILRDDGGMSVRVEAKFAGQHKHEKMVARNINRKSSDPVTLYDQAKQYLFGKSTEE
jgi:hypothetical protein